jgi:hypothetical protein
MRIAKWIKVALVGGSRGMRHAHRQMDQGCTSRSRLHLQVDQCAPGKYPSQKEYQRLGRKEYIRVRCSRRCTKNQDRHQWELNLHICKNSGNFYYCRNSGYFYCCTTVTCISSEYLHAGIVNIGDIHKREYWRDHLDREWSTLIHCSEYWR